MLSFLEIQRGALIKAALAATLFIGSATASRADTSFVLETTDEARIYGRVMAYGPTVPTTIGLFPRGFQFLSKINGKDGLSWKGKHAFIAARVFNRNSTIDGINEYGLTGGALYFPRFAQYKKPTYKDAERKKEINPLDFLTWALSNFKTVGELQAAIDKINLVGAHNDEIDQVVPLHYTFHDAAGFSIAVEPIGGELKILENPFSVLTNAPNLEWHLQNVRNYLTLTPYNVGIRDILDKRLTPFGLGSGLQGLPGDPTSTSRFIQALVYISTVDKQALNKNRIQVAEHILNNFDLPLGIVRPTMDETGEREEPFDYTQWTVVANITMPAYYIKTYHNQVLHLISFDDFDLDGSELTVLELPPRMDYPSLLDVQSK